MIRSDTEAHYSAAPRTVHHHQPSCNHSVNKVNFIYLVQLRQQRQFNISNFGQIYILRTDILLLNCCLVVELICEIEL